MKKQGLLFIFLSFFLNSDAQTYNWAKSIGAADDDEGTSIVVDASGNVYSTGRFRGTVDFDPGAGTSSLTSAGAYDIFISKMDASGNFVWARRIGGPDIEGIPSIAVDASGNVYSTGSFYGTVDFDPGSGTSSLTSVGTHDIFISKLDASGNYVWAKSMGGAGVDVGTSIAVDASGNVYSTGRFEGLVDFDPGPGTSSLISAGDNDIFVSKLNASGNYLWTKGMGGAGLDVGASIALDASGNVYSTGRFTGTVDFDPGAGTSSLTAAGAWDIFISKLDASGNFSWARGMGGVNSDEGCSISIDASGNVYSMGKFRGTVDFDPGAGTSSLTASGAYDIFISKLDASGNFTWAKAINGGINDDADRSISTDGSGNVYSTGRFSGTVDFDPGAGTSSLTSAGSSDIFISKLDASGNFVWARGMGGTDIDEGLSISIDTSGNVYSTGSFSGTADFDPGPGTSSLTAVADKDIFIAKLSPDTDTPAVISPVAYCQGAPAVPLTATAGSSDTLYWYAADTGGMGSKTAPTPATTSTGTFNYYVSARSSSGSESARSMISVQVNALAVTPAVSTPVSYCQNATAVPLMATPGSSSDTLLWYSAAMGGPGGKTAPTPSTATAGTTAYYVSGKTVEGCEGNRAKMDVTVRPSPATPTVSSPVSYCQDATTIPLTASPGSSSDTLLWYGSATGGTGSKTVPTPSAAVHGLFFHYVGEKDSSGCESSRARIQVNIWPKPDSVQIKALSATTFCAGDSVRLLGKATVQANQGHTPFFSVGADGTKICNCPPGSVATGFGGKFGGAIDGFYLYCKQLNRYGILSSTYDSTAYIGNTTGGSFFSAPRRLFGGDTMMVGAFLQTDSVNLGTVASFGQGFAYIKALGNNKLFPRELDTMSGYYTKAASSYLWAPDGYVFTGMTGSGSGSYANSVSFSYTPAGAFQYSYNWSTGDTTGQITVKTSGTFTLTATNGYGCSASAPSVNVVVNPRAAVPTVSSPVNYCKDATAVTLTATKGSAADTLYWYTSATATTGSKVAPTPSTTTAGTTSYYVSARTSENCESARAKIDVTVNAPAAQPTAASPINLCQGATATALTATKGSSSDTLLWYTTATGGTGSKTAPTPSTAATGTTSYYVSAKSSKGCESKRDTIEVIVNPVPAVPGVSTPVVYCQNATATALTATRGSSSDTLFWYTAATGGTGSKTAPTPSTASAGTSSRYVSAKNTQGCLSNRAKIDITINPKGATPTVTTPVHYCQYATAVPLTAMAGSSSDTLFWYTGAAGGTGSKTAPTPSTAVPGTTPYYVSAKTNLGCEGDRAIINVQVNPPADTPVASSPVVYCQNDKAFILVAAKGTPSDTLLWYTVPSGGTASRAAPIPSTAAPGSTLYYVSAISSFGCEGERDTIEVIVNPAPAVTVHSLSPTGSIRCRNVDSVVLKATAPTAIAYQWYFEDTLQAGSTYDTAHARATGYWYAVVTDAKGCRGKDSLWVQRDTLEDPVLTAPENRICKGASVLLTCSPGYVVNRFRWYRNGVLLTGIPLTRSITSVSDTGYYRVVVTNAAGCTYATNRARVDFYPPTPKPSLVYTPPLLSITGGTYRAFQWYQDTKWIFGATGKTYTVSSKGKFYVEVTDANGCTINSDTLDIQPPTGINPQYADMKVRLYPNPTHTSVTIDAPIKVNVMVTDIAGKTLLSIKNATTVDLADFADGSYFFRITDENGQTLGTEKINKISAP